MHFYNLIVNYYCSVISISNSRTLVKTQENGTYLFIHDFAPGSTGKAGYYKPVLKEYSVTVHLPKHLKLSHPQCKWWVSDLGGLETAVTEISCVDSHCGFRQKKN